jgi:hypothetical protein
MGCWQLIIFGIKNWYIYLLYCVSCSAIQKYIISHNLSYVIPVHVLQLICKECWEYYCLKLYVIVTCYYCFCYQSYADSWLADCQNFNNFQKCKMPAADNILPIRDIYCWQLACRWYCDIWQSDILTCEYVKNHWAGTIW